MGLKSQNWEGKPLHGIKNMGQSRRGELIGERSCDRELLYFNDSIVVWQLKITETIVSFRSLNSHIWVSAALTLLGDSRHSFSWLFYQLEKLASLVFLSFDCTTKIPASLLCSLSVCLCLLFYLSFSQEDTCPSTQFLS